MPRLIFSGRQNGADWDAEHGTRNKGRQSSKMGRKPAPLTLRYDPHNYLKKIGSFWSDFFHFQKSNLTSICDLEVKFNKGRGQEPDDLPPFEVKNDQNERNKNHEPRHKNQRTRPTAHDPQKKSYFSYIFSRRF